MLKSDIFEQIKVLTDQYFLAEEKPAFVPGKSKIFLAEPTFGAEEVKEAMDALLTTRVTMGKKVKDFELAFSQYAGVKHSFMVPSGSVANLLALSVLTNPRYSKQIKPGSEIITPAVTFATTIYPIVQTGCVPVLVDVNLHDLNNSLEDIERAITEKTRAIMPVHLLGSTCDIEKIMKLAQKYNLLVIEDTCDSSGAEIYGKKAGSFGDIGTYSFFFTHIMTTMEGGMVTTNDEEIAELINSLRTFGWIRDSKNKAEIASQYPTVDPKFLFYNVGYNFKPTDVQGAFGIPQLKKLDAFVEIRRKNAAWLYQKLNGKYSKYFHFVDERPFTKNAWYGFPVIIKQDSPFTKSELCDFLASKGLETRPLLSGNFAEQPSLQLFDHKIVGGLPNSKLIQKNGFFFGNHQEIGDVELQSIVSYFDEFMVSKNIG